MNTGQKIRQLALGLLLCAGAALAAGCATESQDLEVPAIGRLSLPLSVATDEYTYRLVNAQLNLSGPKNQTFSPSPSDELLTLSLPIGQYVVTLQQGWQIQRLDGFGATTTMNEAVLTSQNPIAVDIDSQLVTSLRFDFDVSGRGIAFGEGGLEIAINVCDDPEGCLEEPADPDPSPVALSSNALSSLCPSGTVGLAGAESQTYLEMTGKNQGELEGDVTSPVPGAWNVLGTCNSFVRPESQGGGTTVLRPSPWYFFLPPNEALIFLQRAWSTAETMDEMVFHYYQEENGGSAVKTQEVSLKNARIWGVDRLVLPDAQATSGVIDVVRVQVGYQEMAWLSSESAFLTEIDGPAQALPTDTPACSASLEGEYQYFLEVDDASVGSINGDSDFPGEEGTVEVYGLCHSSLPGTGILKMGPLTVVKQTDSTTAAFLHMLDSFSQAQVKVRAYRTGASNGSLELVASYELENARLTSLEQTLVSDTQFERLAFDFESLTLTWNGEVPREFQY